MRTIAVDFEIDGKRQRRHNFEVQSDDQELQRQEIIRNICNEFSTPGTPVIPGDVKLLAMGGSPETMKRPPAPKKELPNAAAVHKMNKAQVITLAKELGLEVDLEKSTADQLRELCITAIEEKQTDPNPNGDGEKKDE